MDIRVVALGAGQDVGRSCVLVNMAGKTIMFDAGMHAGYDDHRRFPDFDFISRSKDLSNYIDCVVVSHFHLDHCGALPFFTEVRGYSGPILMTYPTKSICPILLEDYRKITVEKLGGVVPPGTFFTGDDIRNCMAKVTPMQIGQTICINGIQVTPYYAGHVLGAAMFLVRIGHQSALYTGDYNMTPDRHLGAASVPCLRPDVVISESTYADTIRDSKRLRERQLLQQIHDCVAHGGKVLIPVFALGRAQELMLLIEMYWERMQLDVPVYISQGLSARATQYYKLYISWTSENIKKTFLNQNMFDFKFIKIVHRGVRIFYTIVCRDATFNADLGLREGAMVVFATPGMLHAGQSLEIFKHWCSDAKNLVILPGYCVAGTIGNKILSGQKKVKIDPITTVDVNCGISKVSFSAHADAKGIIQLVRQVRPRHVVLVHGERNKMDVLAKKVEADLAIKCHFPAIGTLVKIEPGGDIPAFMSEKVLHSALKNDGLVHGYLSMDDDAKLKIMSLAETVSDVPLPEFVLEFEVDIPISKLAPVVLLTDVAAGIERYFPECRLHMKTVKGGSSIGLHARSVSIQESVEPQTLLMSWKLPDDDLATSIRLLITNLLSVNT